jgi:hypothetical protein
MAGEVMTDKKTRFYQTCETGQWSDTMLIPNDEICYLNTIYPSTFCGGMSPQPECSFSGFQCINSDGLLTATECTSQYLSFYKIN